MVKPNITFSLNGVKVYKTETKKKYVWPDLPSTNRTGLYIPSGTNYLSL